ncbi:DUF3307 domain-containing protein [Candidatus Peregrinibacteria bacterium]|nr:MAG: DUF3307 domain-containing protein [Candidatus Peregrinibacteria bacterium]
MPAVLFEMLLAHFLGDFVFQSNDLIVRKYRSWTGTFEHVCIISFFTVLFLFPYWHYHETWRAASLIFVTHFFQDILKIKYDIHFNAKRKSTLPFFMDQFLHIGLIVYLTTLFSGLEASAMPIWLHNLYFSQLLTLYLLGLVGFSFVYDLTAFQFLRQKSEAPLTYTPNYKGMRNRLLWFSVAYVLFLLVNGSLV